MEILICKPGELVDLVPEPGNPKDPRAIAVFSERQVQIGYVRAEQAQWIGTLLRDGRVTGCIFQMATDYGAAIRLGIDGAEPALPAAASPLPAPDDSSFFPDEEWSDE